MKSDTLLHRMFQNAPITLLSLMVGGLLICIIYSVLPHTTRYVELQEYNQPYYALTLSADYDTMNVHGARYREMIDGSLIPREVDTFEYKDGPRFWPILSASVLAPFFITTQSLNGGIILSDLVFPLLSFLCLFLIIRSITRSPLFAIVSAYVFLVFPLLSNVFIPSSIFELQQLINPFVSIFPEVGLSELTYLRRESFIPSAPFFLLALYFTFQVLSVRFKERLNILLAGITFGSLFYLYFYFFTYMSVFLGILCAALFIGREREKALNVLRIIMVGALVSIPFWINQYELTTIPYYTELVGRMGLETGHGFRWFLWKTYVLFLSLGAVLIWLGYAVKKKIEGLFLVSLACASIAVLNINVITGFVPQSDHWASRVFVVTNAILFSSLLYFGYVFLCSHVRVQKYRFVLVCVVTTLVVSLTGNTVLYQFAQARDSAQNHTIDSALQNAYNWLNANTELDSVVLTPDIKLNTDLVAYTHNRIFLPRSQTTLAPETEILSRLYYTYTLFTIPAEELKESLTQQEWVFNFFTASYKSRDIDVYLRPGDRTGHRLPEELQRQILNEYKAYTIPEDLPYRVDYILVDSRKKNWTLDEHPSITLRNLYHEDGVAILAITHSKKRDSSLIK